MEGKVDLVYLRPDPWLLALGVLLDFAFGDPRIAWHPVRLMGRSLTDLESMLRKLRFDGYAGGILLFLLLAAFWVGSVSVLLMLLTPWLSKLAHVLIVYSMLALHDLLRHGWSVEKAARQNDLPAAREAISNLVGRDTSMMDIAACRRAAIESLSENLTDGFLSPIFWYVLLGVPGIVLFKIVSTMDSMVGYKTPRYLRFGWCGARTDDLMNWLPARLCWLLLSALSFVMPNYSGLKCLRFGWQQHSIVPGPNSGWSEAAVAGALQRKLVGPIWAEGQKVTERWLGDPGDPPAGLDQRDFTRGAILVALTGLAASAIAIAATFATRA